MFKSISLSVIVQLRFTALFPSANRDFQLDDQLPFTNTTPTNKISLPNLCFLLIHFPFPSLKTPKSSLTISCLLPWHLTCPPPPHLYVLTSNVSNKYSFPGHFFCASVTAISFCLVFIPLVPFLYSTFFLSIVIKSTTLTVFENLVIIPLIKVNSYYSLAQNSGLVMILPSNPMY